MMRTCQLVSNGRKGRKKRSLPVPGTTGLVPGSKKYDFQLSFFLSNKAQSRFAFHPSQDVIFKNNISRI